MAVAGGAAFSFSYAETAELLAAAGAEVARVDPLRDEALPPGTAALVLGGGFPEVHVADLAANEPLRADVARLARAGRPVIAECAGLLYLARELDGLPMCGVLDVTAGMTARLTLGYRDATAAADSVLAPAGAAVRGHEFHRTAVGPPHSPTPRGWWGTGRRDSLEDLCTRHICTCTGRGTRSWRGGSSRRQRHDADQRAAAPADRGRRRARRPGTGHGQGGARAERG